MFGSFLFTGSSVTTRFLDVVLFADVVFTVVFCPISTFGLANEAPPDGPTKRGDVLRLYWVVGLFIFLFGVLIPNGVDLVFVWIVKPLTNQK